LKEINLFFILFIGVVYAMKEIILCGLAVLGIMSLFSKKKEDRWLWVGFGPDPFAKKRD
jgi:hypothetical protein